MSKKIDFIFLLVMVTLNFSCTSEDNSIIHGKDSEVTGETVVNIYNNFISRSRAGGNSITDLNALFAIPEEVDLNDILTLSINELDSIQDILEINYADQLANYDSSQVLQHVLTVFEEQNINLVTNFMRDYFNLGMGDENIRSLTSNMNLSFDQAVVIAGSAIYVDVVIRPTFNGQDIDFNRLNCMGQLILNAILAGIESKVVEEIIATAGCPLLDIILIPEDVYTILALAKEYRDCLNDDRY